MNHPLLYLSAQARKTLLVTLLVAMLLIFLVMGVLGGPLNTPAAPNGIVSFEVAGTEANAQAILASWDEGAKTRAGFIQGLDSLFLLVYSTAFALACLGSAQTLKARGWPLASWGIPIAWGQWLAAGFDFIENLALDVQLMGAVRSPWPQLALVCAGLKFGLLFIGLVYIFFAQVTRLAPTRLSAR